ncbi:hypothetical protein Pmani_034558 [Petrolisthes manimaculis]|uniref:Uncharacterized protein n=1 Tax=Petrolisthes manimaculis TaxID=1843537 RepID=A0AAE1NP23_9EUCA|nr:hypothetical protein Pmani_034558 [Petrolisthes manimaculis]
MGWSGWWRVRSTEEGELNRTITPTRPCLSSNDRTVFIGSSPPATTPPRPTLYYTDQPGKESPRLSNVQSTVAQDTLANQSTRKNTHKPSVNHQSQAHLAAMNPATNQSPSHPGHQRIRQLERGYQGGQ